MLLWRGVATIVLDGRPIAPFPEKYLRLFESYLPATSDATYEKFGDIEIFDEWVDKYILMITLIVTLIAILAYVTMEIVSRRNKIKNNYTVSSNFKL